MTYQLEAALKNPERPSRTEAMAEIMREREASAGACTHLDLHAAGFTGAEILAYADQARALLARSAAGVLGRTGPQAANDVIAERLRQIANEGWTPEHDDRQRNGELAAAAACYASFAGSDDQTRQTHRPGSAFKAWPWESTWWKPADRRRDLVKAGALILAEIERLDRADASAITELNNG